MSKNGESALLPPVGPSTALRAAWPVFAFGLGYFALACASLYFTIPALNFSPVWLPGGLGLVLLVLSRQNGWRFALPVIFIANLSANLLFDSSLPASLGFALTGCLEAWLAAAFLQRYLPDLWKASAGLDNAERVLGLFAVITISTAFSAALFALILLWQQSPRAIVLNWLGRWVSSGFGIILVAPLVLAWIRPQSGSRPCANKYEQGVIFLAQGCMALSLFFAPQAILSFSVFRLFILLPLFTWAMLRFNERYNLNLMALVVLLALLGTRSGLGEFSDTNIPLVTRLLNVQSNLGVMMFFFFLLKAFLNEQWRIEAGLQESSSQYRLITGTTLDGFWVCDQHGTLLDVNEKLCLLLGYPREELLGMDVKRVDSSGMDPWAYSPHLTQSADPSSDLYEAVYRQKNGQLIDVELSLTGTANPERCLAFVRDISARKQGERISIARMHLAEYAETHSLEELLTATLDEAEGLTGSRIGFYHFMEEDQATLSLQTWSTRTLNQFCTASGKGQHYPLDKAGVWADCVRERRAVIHNDYAALLHRKGLPEGHAQVRRELVTPVFRGERIICILGVGNKEQDYTQRDVDIVSQLADLALDITERKRTELALQKSKLLLSETQALSGVGGWEYDVITRKMLWTDEVYRIYGVSKDHDPDDINLAISFFSPQDQHSIADAFEAATLHGKPYSLELGFINGQGQYRWVSTRGNPLLRNGQVVKVTGNIVDITESKMAEEALLLAYKNLEAQMEANNQLQALLLEQATHDSLTSLYNRRFMEDALRHELTRAEREGYAVSVLMLDIDFFKPFNDTYGHDAGDQVLIALGQVLQSNIRESDFACRYGGEEFVIIMPRASLTDARTRADLIRQSFSSMYIPIEKYQVSSTVSVGVACYPACPTRDELLRAADAAMYIAKQTGRNKVCVWSARKPAAQE